MRNNTSTFILAAITLMAAACNKTSTPEAPFDPVVRVSPEVARQTKGSYTTDNLKEFDLFIHSADSKYSYTNTKFTKNAETGEWEPARTMLWEGKKTKFDFLAIAPPLPASGHSISGTQVFSFAVEEVQTEGSTASDLLWAWKYDASCEDSDLFDGKKMKIAFSHACSLIRVKLTLGTEFNHDGVPQSNPISELKIDGLLVEANIQHNLVNNDPYHTYATGAAKTVQAYQSKWEKYDDKTKNCIAVFECIVVPQNWTKFTVNFICGGKPYTYTADSGQYQGLFESGKSYTLPLTVGKDEVIMSKDGITASPWGDGGSTDIETD